MPPLAPRALLLVLLCCITETAQSQTSACIFTQNQAAVVSIEYKYVTSDGEGHKNGSGFIISPAGHVITNAHVVSPRLDDIAIQSSSIQIRAGSVLSNPYAATVIARDASVDLALLKLPPRLDGTPWPTTVVGKPDNLPVGARLIGLGFPLSGDISVVPAGEKTAHNTVVDGQLTPWWQTSLALNPGNSGGPIFGQLGTVVGVAVAKNNGGQLVTYVIPIARAQHLLDAAGEVHPSEVASCADFPECRHAGHGIEFYEIDERESKWSEWRGGGYNEGAFCGDFLAELQNAHPNSSFTLVRSSQEYRDDKPPFRVIKYRYFCEFHRLENPIYRMQKSSACLR